MPLSKVASRFCRGGVRCAERNPPVPLRRIVQTETIIQSWRPWSHCWRSPECSFWRTDYGRASKCSYPLQTHAKPCPNEFLPSRHLRSPLRCGLSQPPSTSPCVVAPLTSSRRGTLPAGSNPVLERPWSTRPACRGSSCIPRPPPRAGGGG